MRLFKVNSNMVSVLFAAVFGLSSMIKVQAQIIIGTNQAGNVIPFGFGTSVYQQVYAASDFSASININGLTFFGYDPSGDVIPSNTFVIQLSTTSAAVNGLSTNFSSNLGTDNTTVFDGIISGSADPSFTIPISAYKYNPKLGNLLLTIEVSNPINSQTDYLESETAFPTDPSIFSRAYHTAYGLGTDNAGLVTEFDLTSAPEPAAWSLELAGIIILIFWTKNRLLSGAHWGPTPLGSERCMALRIASARCRLRTIHLRDIGDRLVIVRN